MDLYDYSDMICLLRLNYFVCGANVYFSPFYLFPSSSLVFLSFVSPPPPPRPPRAGLEVSDTVLVQ